MMRGTGFAKRRRDEEEEEKEETRESVPLPTPEPTPPQKREDEAGKAKTRVEIGSRPKGPSPIAIVNARHAGEMMERAARGFSLGELSASILSFERAKKWRVPLDVRRRTALDGNVTRLTSWLHTAKPRAEKTEPEKPTVEIVLKAEKPSEPEKPKEEEKPVEVAKLKAQRGVRRKEPKKEKPVKEPKKVARPKPAKKTKTKTKTKKE